MTETFKPNTMVEHSPGGLALVLEGPRRRYGRDEYKIWTLNTGTGDGFGMTDWWPADQIKSADMQQWIYDANRNVFRRNHSAGGDQ